MSIGPSRCPPSIRSGARRASPCCRTSAGCIRSAISSWPSCSWTTSGASATGDLCSRRWIAPAGTSRRARSVTSRGLIALAVVLAIGSAALAIASPRWTVATAVDRWEGLQALPRVAVEVTVLPHHPDLSGEVLVQRITEALRRNQPAPTVDPASPDRLHLMVMVKSYSSADLRGYYLPLSQAYGIGPVRLVVERQAQVAGLPGPVAAQVWQAERQAKGPWRSSAAEILSLADEVVSAFLADYRRAVDK